MTKRDVFHAIADPVRRGILDLLGQGEALSLNAVAEHFNVSRPAISRHIKILAECNLVHIEPQGRERFCSLNPQPLREVNDWLEEHKPFKHKKKHRKKHKK